MNWQLTSGSGSRSVWSLGIWSFDSDHLHWNDLYFHLKFWFCELFAFFLEIKYEMEWSGARMGQSYIPAEDNYAYETMKKTCSGTTLIFLKSQNSYSTECNSNWATIRHEVVNRRARFLETISVCKRQYLIINVPK